MKIRIEIDGNGNKPDYFLNYVELKDLDTNERFVVMCGKWLRWNCYDKGAQPFRVIFIKKILKLPKKIYLINLKNLILKFSF